MSDAPQAGSRVARPPDSPPQRPAPAGPDLRVVWRRGHWTIARHGVRRARIADGLDDVTQPGDDDFAGPAPGDPGARSAPAFADTRRTRLSLTDIVALVGGSVGVVYLVGYLVLAAHMRALGLPVRSSDTPALLASAWEFVLRGLLVVFITIVGWLGAWNPLLLISLVVILAIGIAALILRRRRGRVAADDASTVKRLRSRVTRAVALLLALTSIWLFAQRTIPLMGIQNLLFTRGQASPFDALPPWVSRHLSTRLQELQSSLTGTDARGDAAYGDPDRRARIFTGQMLLTLACLAAWIAAARGRRRHHAPRWIARLLLGLTIVHALFAPIYYGVLVKSYRYPQVQLTLTPTGDKAIDELYADYPFRLLSLVDTTDQELYLYDRASRQLTLVRRDKLAHLRIVDSDFVLGGE